MVAPRRGPRNVRVEQPRLLLVEGDDDEHFFRHLIEKRSLADTQIIQYSERGGLGDFLANVLTLDSGFYEIVKVIGVVKDADRDYQRAFQSVQGSLHRAKLPVPQAPLNYGASLDVSVRVIAYIMPDNSSRGDLETLCLNAVSGAPAMPCVDRYFDCLQSIDQVPRQESKARLRAFLSANIDNPNLLIGQAISAGVLPWDSPAFAGIHQFLDLLSAVD